MKLSYSVIYPYIQIKGYIMSHSPHELREDFPEYTDKIHKLKISDNHFVKLAAKYHDVNREIHRIETGKEHVPNLLKKISVKKE